jgi:hypothetical protein
MPRIRTVKPEFWRDAKVSRVSRDARLTFLGLLNEADDEGRLLGSAKYIAGALFPHDDDADSTRVRGWLDELSQTGLIRRYEHEEVGYLVIPNFRTHQRIDKPSESKLPPPPKRIQPADSENPRGTVAEASQTDPRQEVEVEREVEVGSGTSLAPSPAQHESKARPRDEIWDALVACFGDPPATKSFRGGWNKAAAEIRAQGATPTDVAMRVAVYKTHMPDVECTPMALAKHWGRLSPDPPPASRSVSKFEAARAERRLRGA